MDNNQKYADQVLMELFDNCRRTNSTVLFNTICEINRKNNWNINKAKSAILLSNGTMFDTGFDWETENPADLRLGFCITNEIIEQKKDVCFCG